jgi:Fur family transcriptional regulator, ferric uptake regulator
MARKPVISAAILGLMRGHARHAWTLEDFRAALVEDEVAADFSSIFRAVEKLVAEHVVRKLILDDGRTRFELSEAHHDHLRCTSCGELIAVPCFLKPADFAVLERDAGIVVSGHHLVLSGLCRECRVP